MTRPALAVLACAGLLLLLGACATVAAPANAPPPAQLADCPSAPHCVNSLATDDGHRVMPFYLKQPAAQAWPAIVAAVKASARTTVVQEDSHYLRAEVLSPWHIYIDDLELMLRDNGLVDVRSSSRVGYYDFGVNRKRVDTLRATLVAQGLIAN